MRPALLILLALLAACTEDTACTPETARAKAARLNAAIAEIGVKDPARLAELGPKVQELAAKAQGGGDSLTAACAAMDAMLAELGG